MGLGHRIEQKRPWLSARQKEARLKFAQDHIHRTKEDWRYVEFSDEMGIQTGANDNRVYVWCYPEEEYKEDCCAATNKSGFKKIKIWGSMRYESLSNLVILPEKEGEGKFNAREYVKEMMGGSYSNAGRRAWRGLGTFSLWRMEWDIIVVLQRSVVNSIRQMAVGKVGVLELGQQILLTLIHLRTSGIFYVLMLRNGSHSRCGRQI